MTASAIVEYASLRALFFDGIMQEAEATMDSAFAPTDGSSPAFIGGKSTSDIALTWVYISALLLREAAKRSSTGRFGFSEVFFDMVLIFLAMENIVRINRE